MANLRFNLDLSIPEDINGVETGGIKIPLALALQIPTIRDYIKKLKSYARKINEGKPNEEMTVRAVWHICRHDEPLPHPQCGPYQEI